MRIAVAGATGLVGGAVLDWLGQPEWAGTEVVPYATSGNGRTVMCGAQELQVQALPTEPPDVDFAFLAIPNDTARAIVPAWTKAGIRIVDKSSAYRLDPNVPLVVPEVNGDRITRETYLIANPNCSTIPLAVALQPLRKAYGIRRVDVATYQAVSGAGFEAVKAWQSEIKGAPLGNSPFPQQIHGNVIPAIGSADEQGWYTEETKVNLELRKILDDDSMAVACTAVRVPVMAGHSEAVVVKLGRETTIEEVLEVLGAEPALTLERDPRIPLTPLQSEGNDNIFVGRVRIDPFDRRRVHLWVVTDNLRKGAATNAIQILRRWIDVIGE